MMRGISLFHGLRRAGLWLALIALAIKVAVPAGFMVGTDAHNQLAITLCSGHGSAEATLDLTTGQIIEHGLEDKTPKIDDKSKHSQICPFASAAGMATAPSLASLAAPFTVALDVDTRPLWLRPQLSPTGPPLPARGPPLFA